MKKTTKGKFGNRTKANDKDIIVLNSLGLSLSTIGATLGIVPTTVSSRLRANGIEPIHSGKAFIEGTVIALTEHQRQWLASKVSPQFPINNYVHKLITEQYEREHTANKPLTFTGDINED